MSQRTPYTAGALILSGLAALVGCPSVPSAERVSAHVQELEQHGYKVLKVEDYRNLTDQEQLNERLNTAVDARLSALTGIVNIDSAATAYSFYGRIEVSRRRAENAVADVRDFQQRQGKLFEELEQVTRDPIQTYGQSIKNLRARMGEFQIALDVQAQVMDTIWRRYESFCTFYITKNDELRRELEANYQQTRRVMDDTSTPLPQRIECWRQQAQSRSQLRERSSQEIDRRADTDLTQSREDIDNLLRALNTTPQRP